jgi:hypothetical protein
VRHFQDCGHTLLRQHNLPSLLQDLNHVLFVFALSNISSLFQVQTELNRIIFVLALAFFVSLTVIVIVPVLPRLLGLTFRKMIAKQAIPQS